jgi:hypothetical protein
MAGTIIVDRIESDASYASSINVAAQVTFSNTVSFSSTANVTGNMTVTGKLGIGTASPGANVEVKGSSGQNIYVSYTAGSQLRLKSDSGDSGVGTTGSTPLLFLMNNGEVGQFDTSSNFKFNSGYGSVATAYGCRAWVNFNGTGTVAIRASGNVSSITDNGVGDYRVNFTTAMPDINYSALITSGQKGVVWGISLFSTSNPFLITSVGVVTQTPSDTPNDNPYVCVSIFR